MAFEPRSLALFNSCPYGPGGAVPAKNINFYNYATADAAATVTTAGYFNAARDKLELNDLIGAMCVADGTGDFVTLRVTAVPAAPGNVTVAADTGAVGT